MINRKHKLRDDTILTPQDLHKYWSCGEYRSTWSGLTAQMILIYPQWKPTEHQRLSLEGPTPPSPLGYRVGTQSDWFQSTHGQGLDAPGLVFLVESYRWWGLYRSLHVNYTQKITASVCFTKMQIQTNFKALFVDDKVKFIEKASKKPQEQVKFL